MTQLLPRTNSLAMLGTIYWLAGLASILYPGTDGIDPEFGPSGFPQAPIFVGFASCAVLGWLLERRGLIGEG